MSKYTKEELDEIIQKEVEIILGDSDDDEDTFSFKGKMISFNMAEEDPNIPTDFCFHTYHGAIKKFNFSNLKNIRIL